MSVRTHTDGHVANNPDHYHSSAGMEVVMTAGRRSRATQTEADVKSIAKINDLLNSPIQRGPSTPAGLWCWMDKHAYQAVVLDEQAHLSDGLLDGRRVLLEFCTPRAPAAVDPFSSACKPLTG
eukprot:363326-Chlamydomonas_euryale.AAC.9